LPAYGRAPVAAAIALKIGAKTSVS